MHDSSDPPNPYVSFVAPNNPDRETHYLHTYIMEGTTGLYVGHERTLGIIVQGETKKVVLDKVAAAVNYLWKEVPEAHDRLYPNHVSAKSVKGSPEASFNQQIAPVLIARQ